jgi:hypothetical protein
MPTDRLPRRIARQCDHADEAARHVDVELSPRAHPRLLGSLELPAQPDAGHPLCPLDPLAGARLIGIPRDQPRLLVGDMPLAHRVARDG